MLANGRGLLRVAVLPGRQAQKGQAAFQKAHRLIGAKHKQHNWGPVCGEVSWLGGMEG